jgi:excisionase family DNA binding protein
MKVPASLSDLFAALERAAAGLPPDQVPALLGELERLRASLWGRVRSLQLCDDAYSAPQGGDDRLLTIPEVAELLTMHVSSLYEMARRGELPSVRVGKHVRVSATALRQWIAQREHVGYSAQPRGRLMKSAGTAKRSA